MKLKELIACTIGALMIALMGASLIPARAQVTTTTGSSAILPRWNSANEISFSGTIQEVVTDHAAGTPTGVNLLLDGTQSFQYANLGSQINSSLKSELTAGQPVTLKGIVRNFNGQNILLVRQITIDQRTTQVRSLHGITSPLVESSALQGNRPRGRNTVDGGAQ